MTFSMEISLKFLLFPLFSLFLVFKHDFIRCVDFTRFAASNTANDDVSSVYGQLADSQVF